MQDDQKTPQNVSPVTSTVVPVQPINTSIPLQPVHTVSPAISEPTNSPPQEKKLPPLQPVSQNPQPIPQAVPSQINPTQYEEEPLPPTHIGSGNKEQEPLPPMGNTEWGSLVEPEIPLSEEVKEVGVVSVPQQQPPLQTLQPVVLPSTQEAPVIPEESELTHFPMTLLQTQDVIKKDKDMQDSLRWLATLIFREIGIAARRKREQENKQIIQ